jgi:hypothetical protein
MFVQLLKDFLGKPAGERIDVTETGAKALVAQEIATPIADDLITPAVQKAMEQAFAGFQKSLDAVIQTALAQFQNAQSKSRRNGTPIIFGDDGGDIHGKSFGDWLVQVAILGSHKAADRVRRRFPADQPERAG